jgi:hypothetical protein
MAGPGAVEDRMSADLWVVTSYFNPCGYRVRRENFDRFLAGMESVGANVLTVELAFGDAKFELPEGPNVLRKRSDSILWHKERLLNIAAASLPAECTKVAWFDNDIMFDDPRWLERTAKALDTHIVVQPFSSCNWLERGETGYPPSGGTYESFAHCFVRAPNLARATKYVQHGHTGFAWAARRELFETCGLYDSAPVGGGDHLMAHAFAGGMIHSPCLKVMVGKGSAHSEHFWKWAVKARDLVDGRIGYVPGSVLHLWHGDLANRGYATRDRQLRALGFDPDRHLATAESGLVEWSEAAPAELRAWVKENFERRQEDGGAETPAA